MQRKRLYYRSSTAWIAVLGVFTLVASPAIAAANCCCRSAGQDSPDATCCSAESAAAIQGSGCHTAAGGDALACCGNSDATSMDKSQSIGTTYCCDLPSQCKCVTCCASVTARHIIPTSVVRNQPDDQSAHALPAAELTLDTPWSIPTSSTRVAGPIAFLLAQQQCALLCRWRK